MPRPKTPSSLKLVKGTARKDRTRPDPKTEALGRVPPPPADLNDQEAAAWRKLGRACVARKTLTAGDLEALACAARAVAMVHRLHAELEGLPAYVETSTGVKTHPVLVECRQWQSTARAWLSSLGLTPSTRSNAAVAGGKAAPSGWDEF